MTVADLLAVLQQCEEPHAEATVRVWETNDATGEPVFSKCSIRDVTDERGIVVIHAEEA